MWSKLLLINKLPPLYVYVGQETIIRSCLFLKYVLLYSILYADPSGEKRLKSHLFVADN